MENKFLVYWRCGKSGVSVCKDFMSSKASHTIDTAVKNTKRHVTNGSTLIEAYCSSNGGPYNRVA